MADGGLLALIACLGLAQLSHETTPALAQIGFTTLTLFGMAATPWRTLAPAVALLLGLAGMALSGAPAMALLLATGGVAINLLDRNPATRQRSRRWALCMALLACAVAALAWALDLYRWRLGQSSGAQDWRSMGRLLLWFTWPAWPLALWTLWRWRRQLTSRHVALPLWGLLVSVGTTLSTPSADRSLLLLGLPALAALAAFALPTLQRSVTALIDWFTLLFFSGCAVTIWVVWIAMQTGVPAKPAANVARLAPGFEPGFSLVAFAVALGATLCWAWLVKWRAGRHRAAIWKSLVLPAGGAALCWLLLLTLWLPLLDYARSYKKLALDVARATGTPECVEVHGISLAQVAALRYHGQLTLRPAGVKASCPWLVVAPASLEALSVGLDMRQWALHATVRRPADADDNLLLYQRPVP
jgi:hypothetical protein